MSTLVTYTLQALAERANTQLELSNVKDTTCKWPNNSNCLTFTSSTNSKMIRMTFPSLEMLLLNSKTF